MTRVVLIANAREPIAEPFAGGLESMCWHLAKGLLEHGVQVELYAGPGSDPRLGVNILPVREHVLSDTARRDVSMPAEHLVMEHFAYQELMVSLRSRGDVDVVHNNSLHYLPLAMAPSIRPPMLTTLHTPPTPWLEPTVRHLVDRRARFVSVSRSTARMWRHVVRSGTIHNGVDTRRWAAGPGGDELLWFGRLVPEKAPHRAIEIARASGRDLVLAGPISDHDYFESAVKPLLDGAVRYVGHLATAELSELVGASAVCLVTSQWDEPFGLVVAEAMSCGTPVVVFNRGGMSEIVAEGGGVVVDGDDQKENVAAVERAIGMDRAQVRAIAVRRFSIDRMIADYLQIYREMSRFRDGEPGGDA